MAALPILLDPDPRLREVSQSVRQFDASYREMLQDLKDTFATTTGIGLAAPQIGYPVRMLIMDTTPDRSCSRVIVNPEILSQAGYAIIDESCVSVPDRTGKVARASRIELSGLDGDGLEFLCRLEGLEAVCLQHELDHLNGKLFTDHLPLWRNLFLKAG